MCSRICFSVYGSILNPNFAINRYALSSRRGSLTKTAEELNIGKGKLIHPVRLALSGIGTGPGIYDLLYILGKDKSMERIDRALKVIKIPNTNGSE